MAKNLDNMEFSARLRQALSRLPNKVDTPTKLAIEFNLIHHESVSNQAVQKWMTGLSKPSREKIETLARMCGVSAQWLRFGIAESHPRKSSAPGTLASPHSKSLSATEQTLLDNFRLLPQVQQELVSGVTEQLAMTLKIWRVD